MNSYDIIEKALPTTIGIVIGSAITVILFFLGKYFDNKKDVRDRKLKIYSKINAITYTLINAIGEKDYHKIYSNYFSSMERVSILEKQSVRAFDDKNNSFNQYLKKREETLNLLSQLNEYIYEYSYLTKRKDVVNALHELLGANLDSDFDYKFRESKSLSDSNIILYKLLDNLNNHIALEIRPKIKNILDLFENRI